MDEQQATTQTQTEVPAEQRGGRATRPAYGVLVDHGAAPYKNDPEASMNYYATLKGSSGLDFTIWGKEVQTALQGSGVQVGQHIELANLGSRPVTVNEQVAAEDGSVRLVEKHSHVNQWAAREVPERRAEQGRKKPARSTQQDQEHPGLGGQALPTVAADATSSTKTAEPIATQIHQYANAADPRLAKAFAQTENAFALRGRGNLEQARSAGIEMNIDTVEQLDTRLGRDGNGLQAKFLENSYNGPAAGRQDFQTYIAGLRKEAGQHEAQGNKGLAMRYEAQAKFEVAARQGVEATGTRAEFSSKQMAEANADLAKADLEGRSQHMGTAMARLEQFAPQSKTDWIRDTYKTSSLRSSLAVHDRDNYDHYRDFVGRGLAEKKGLDPATYAMTPAEALAYDLAFVAYQDSRVRGVHLAEQRTATQGKAIAPADINGTRKADDAGVEKVPQPVAVSGFESRRAEDGRTLEYTQQGSQEVSFRDTGEKVSVRSGSHSNAEVLRGALTVASEKFERISLNGSREFRENAAREAVRMGLGERITNQDLQSVIQDEQQKLQSAQRHSGEQGKGVTQAAGVKSPELAVEMMPTQQAHAAAVGLEKPATAQSEAKPLEQPTQKAATQTAEQQRGETEVPSASKEWAQHEASVELPVKLMENAKGSSREVGGDERLPVMLMNDVKGKNLERVGGSEELPIVLADQSESLTAAQNQGNAIGR